MQKLSSIDIDLDKRDLKLEIQETEQKSLEHSFQKNIASILKNFNGKY